MAKQARSAQQNNTATSYINSILNSKSISEAITRITAISKVVTANNDMLKKQESDQKSLLQNKNKTKQLSMRLQLIKAELETTEAGLTTQQAELEAAQVTCFAELTTAQDEKHHLFLLNQLQKQWQLQLQHQLLSLKQLQNQRQHKQ